MAPRSAKKTETKTKAPAKPPKAERKARGDTGTAVKDQAASPAEASGTAAGAAGQVRLKELVDQVAEATGGKRAEVKPVVEALLSAMGAALATGKALTVPPLGKLRVVKNKGPALTLKLRLADGPKAAGLALADDGEDG